MMLVLCQITPKKAFTEPFVDKLDLMWSPLHSSGGGWGLLTGVVGRGPALTNWM